MRPRPPQVIFTDSGERLAAAVRQVMPLAQHKLCVFHLMQNIRKYCAGLGTEALAEMLVHFERAAFAPTDEVRYPAR